MPRTPVLGGSLKLAPLKTLMIGDSAVQQAAARWNTLPFAQEALKKLGVPPLVEPEVAYHHVTAELLLTVNINDYTALYVSQLRWFNYANRALAMCKAELLQVVNQITDLEAEAKKKLRELKIDGKKLAVTEIKEQAENDQGTLDLRIHKQFLEQKKLELEAWVQECDESKKVVSRQIELRREDSNGGKREQNLHAGNQQGNWQPGGFRR